MEIKLFETKTNRQAEIDIEVVRYGHNCAGPDESNDNDDFHKIPSNSLLLVDDDDDNRLTSRPAGPMTKYDGGVTTERVEVR